MALAVSYPFLYFARSTFTEIVMLAAVLGGLWLASVGYASENRATVSIAGMLLGLAALARIDGWMVGVALAWAPTVLVLVDPGIGDRRWVLERLWVGFLVIASLGLVDLAPFSPVYLGTSGTNSCS